MGAANEKLEMKVTASPRILTKGEGFAPNFAERKNFMEKEFVKLNNERFGYNRFSFLYIEDTLTQAEQDTKTITAINNFFK